MKIAFIAMSGIRVVNKELMEIGLTVPGFIERKKTIASLPSLGLLTLAGMTPAGHELFYIEVADLRDFDISKADFDLAAISSYSAQIYEAYELADRLRQTGITVVIGGPHVSSLPGEAIQHCDSVVIGEGECSWVELVKDAEKNGLKKFYGSLENEFDMANAPMPAFELLDISKYNRLTVQTSRGCPHFCSFCASSKLLTRKYKQKSIPQVLKEIDKIKNIWKHPFIEFADDNSMVNKNYWKALLPQLRERNIKWFTETDISVGTDEELLAMMRESGCYEVLIGLESPDKEDLNRLELRNNWKQKQWGHVKESIHRIQSHGIRVNGCFILGLDNQDISVFDRVLDYSRELELFDVQVTILTAFPGTPLYKELLSQNRIIRDKAWETCTLFDINIRFSHMTTEEFDLHFKELVRRLYSEELTSWRKENFKHKYLKQLIHENA